MFTLEITPDWYSNEESYLQDKMAFLQPGELQGSPQKQGSPLGQDILLPLETQHLVVLQDRSPLLMEGILQEQQDRCTDQLVDRQTPVLSAETQKWDVCMPVNSTSE